MVARTSVSYVARTDMPCTRDPFCRPSSRGSPRSGITSTRWRRVRGCATSSSNRLAKTDSRVKGTGVDPVGALDSPLAVEGIVVQRNRRDFRQGDTRYLRRDGRGDRDRSRLPPGVQNAIMYPQDWAEDAHALPSGGREGEPAPAAPQILQRTDVVNQGLEVSEYADEAARPGWAGDTYPLIGGREDALAIGCSPLSSDSSGSSKNA